MRAFIIVACVVAGCGGGDPAPMVPGGSGGTGGGGTGGSGWPMVIFSNWDAWLNQGVPPSCEGPMALTWTQQVQGGAIALAGSWSCVESAADCAYIHAYQDASFQCVSYSGKASGTVQQGGAFTLDLDTIPGYGVRVTGTASGDRLVGTAAFSNANIPFLANLL